LIDVYERVREAGWIQCLRLLVASAVLLAAPGVSAAQTTRGSIGGTVRDGQGAAIPGVTVTAASARRNDTQTVTTNDSGDFVILDLLPDTYTLKVTMDGFKTIDRENVVLAANDRLSVGVLTLDLGSVAETVVVTSRVIEVQSRSAERSFSIDTTAMENLAVNGRSPLALTRLAPGIANVNPAGTDLSFNVNGSRSGVHNLTVDGVSNVDTGNNGILGNINMDAVEEFKLLTNAYQAEYGRSSGAQISVVTKSGGRDYRGSAYWYKRHEGFNANSWLNNRERGLALQSDPNSRVGLKAVNRQNDIGYTIGGPIPITGFNKDNSRLFFFFSQEHQRRFTPPANPNLVKVPTALERRGDFSQSVDNTGRPFPYVRDWSTGLPCTASDTRGCFQDGGVLGRIPQNRLYAPGLAILNAYPLPNTSGNGFNYSSQAAADRNRREDILRVDWQANDSWRVFGRYFHNTNNAGNGLDPYGSFVLGANVDVTTVSDLRPVYNYSFSTTGVLSPSLFFEGTVGTGHNALNIYDLKGVWNRTALGVTALPVLFPNGIQDDYPPQIALGGRYGTSPNVGSNNAPFYNFNTTYDFTASVTKLWGRHTSKAGFYAQRSLKDQSGFGSNNGRIEFNDDTANPFDTGYAAANAATGVFRFYDQASIWPVGQYRYWNVEWYAQDNWKVNSRLTLDYGLRFYWVQPQYDQALLASNFIPSTFSQAQAVRLYVPALNGSQRVALDPVTGQTLPEAFIGRIVPNGGSLTNGLHTGADPAVGKYLIQDRGILYAPRVGITYDLTGHQDFIVRAGGGAFYDRYEGNIPFAQITNPPTTLAPRISYGLLQDLNPSAALLAPSGLNAMSYAGQIPVTYNFNLGFQKKLPLNFIWDIAYVGSVQHHLPRQVNINAVPYGATFAPQNQDPTRGASSVPGQNALPQDFLRPYVGYGNINQRLFDANANYHGLQTQVDRRFTNGLFLNVNYTWSKALDTQDGNGDFSRIDQLDKKANYGPAAFDRRHIFNVNWVYELPRVQSAGQWLGGIVNNWQLSGGYRFESGVPYTLGVSISGIGNRNITGSDTEGFRPVLTGNPGAGYSTDPYAQVPVVVTFPAIGTLGFDSGRNYVRRAPINNLDLSLQKSFPIFSSHRALRFRLDAFNALNHTQFDTVNGTLTLRSLTDLTPINLPYDASGNLIVANRNGYGAVTAVRSPRVLQLLVRFEF
jgi:hypothetical protein